jgi:acetylornithine deacetylase/succinyl-diaminopimelate desuccinylase-like protein
MVHGPVEYVKLSQIEQAVDFYQRLMVLFVWHSEGFMNGLLVSAP